jgi:predicted acylesterase/phospholipase RssA
MQLAIQGGGAKICHLLAAMEAIQGLERDGELEITRIAGSSAGAIVACMYAAKIDFAGFRQTLSAGLGKELLELFTVPNSVVMGYSVVKGRPFWDEEALRKIFDRIFARANVRTIADLEQLSGIEVLVLMSNMLEGAEDVAKPSDFISNALLHSAGLPFCFRTWKGQNGAIVDGGICDNFPWEILGTPNPAAAAAEPIVGIVFTRSRPKPPTNFITFSAGLLDLAIDNTMERAKQRLGPDFLFSIVPRVDTLDFRGALARGLDDIYDTIRKESFDFFSKFARNEELQRTDSDVWKGNISMMKRVAEIYNRQHKQSKFIYELCELEVEANSFKGEPDIVKYSAKFKTDKDPIYCHAIAVSDARHKTQIDESRWWMIDEKGNKISCLYLPMRDDDTAQSRELLMFFDPILKPNSGPYLFSVRDEVEELMVPLMKNKSDEMVFTPQRAVGPVGQINLVVHYPPGPKIAFVPKADGQPGVPLLGAALAEYRKRAPLGYNTVGWSGTVLDPSLPFGADLRVMD